MTYIKYQPILEKMEKNIEGLILHQGLPSREQIEEWSDQCEHTVLILMLPKTRIPCIYSV